jgi:hypothetical protein
MARPKTDAATFVHFALRLPKKAMDAVRARSARSGAPLNTELVRAILRDLHMPATAEPADAQADRAPRTPQRPSRATRASF